MDPATDWGASEGKVALDFETDDIVVSGKMQSPQLTSISLWVYLRTGTGICGFANAAQTQRSTYIAATGGGNTYSFYCYDGANKTVLSSTLTVANTWVHVCGIQIPGDSLYIAINGKIEASTAIGTPFDSWSDGPFFHLGLAGIEYLNGKIDDARVYNRALAPSEIATLAQRRGIAYETRRLVSVRGAAGGTTVTPTTATLTLATFAPTVSTPQALTPATLALTLSTFAPTVSTPILATPTTATLTLTTFAPTITATAHVVATPATATLTLTTFEPTVTGGGSATVTPTTAALVLTTFEPTVTAGGAQTVTPTTATLTLATFAPTVSTPQTVTPSTLALTLTTYEPIVSTPQTVTPTTVALTLTAFAPTVTGVAPITVTPTTAALVFTAYAPTVSTVTADQIWTINLTLTGRRTATSLAVTTAASCLVSTAARSTAFSCQFNDAVPEIAAGYGFLVESDGDYLVNSDGNYLIASV